MRKIDPSFVSVCPKCNYTSSGSSPYASFSCPECHSKMINTQMRPEKWASLSISDQTAILGIGSSKFEMTSDLSGIVEEERKSAVKDYATVLAYESFILTTAPTIETRIIEKYLGVQHTSVALGLGISAGISAGLTDLFGSEDSTISKKLSEAKDSALQKLKNKCLKVGANACISVDLDIMSLSNDIIIVSASGTAVVLADESTTYEQEN